jgi:predicted ribosomally synthesized peptide with SipW-like signal peptide
MTSTNTPVRASGTGRKVKAILAGGLVLGIGVAVTLAAWNDSEYATAQFKAGTFNLEGSTTNAPDSFADHATPGTAAVVFDIATYGNVSPGAVLYEQFWVRLAANTTSGAQLLLKGITAGNGGNEENFSYQIYRLTDVGSTCDADGIATAAQVGSGADLSDLNVGPASTLTIGSPTTVAGAALNLCFVVTAGPDLAQTLGASTTWEFEAVSE